MNRALQAGFQLPLYLCLAALLISCMYPAKANAEDTDAIDEISITIKVQEIGNREITALIKNEEVYLPIKELFDLLKIKNTPSADFNMISGFIIDPKALYSIDKLNNRIVYQKTQHALKPGDLILSETDLYLKAEHFGQIFGLNCLFKFRSLSVSLTTKLELPAIREMKLQQMRKNLSALKGEQKADTTLGKSLPLFDLGVADWAITATQDNLGNINNRANLILGGVLAGGEATASLNYDSGRPFNLEDQAFQWRFVDNDRRGLRQITAGRIFTQTTSTLYGPVNGVQLTNTPTTYRKSFGTYRVSNTTEPDWMVELYVNNVLVDYVKADASGFYSFDVPLVYGSSVIRTRVYGPWGEERTEEQNISIPFNFLPTSKIEYVLSAGMVDDAKNSILTRAAFNYGLNDRITIGAGSEYLSSVNVGVPMPFVNSSVRLSSALLVSGQFSPGVNAKGTLNYRLPGNVQLDVNYTKYAKEQTAILYNYREERKVELSAPIRSKHFNAYSRFSLNQFVLSETKVTNAQFLISAVLAGVNTNFSTNALYTSTANPYVYSSLSLSFRMPMALRFTPHIQYEYKTKNIRGMKAELERGLGRLGFATVGYEKSVPTKFTSITLGLRLNLSVAQAYFGITRSNQSTAAVQSASGSLLYSSIDQHLLFSNERSTGKGGLSILPFLDLNNDGKRNSNEPRASGLKVKIRGGRITPDKGDTTINIRGLQAYTNYMIELDENSFDNISWRLKNKSIAVTIEPNHFKSIEVPVSVLAEVAGHVYLTNSDGRKGQGRINVGIYDNHANMIATVFTEPDGYFSYIGLVPGTYTARISHTQLQKLKMQPVAAIPFQIRMNPEGDIVDGLEFDLKDLGKGAEK
jgi:hypothetical protein